MNAIIEKQISARICLNEKEIHLLISTLARCISYSQFEADDTVRFATELARTLNKALTP